MKINLYQFKEIYRLPFIGKDPLQFSTNHNVQLPGSYAKVGHVDLLGSAIFAWVQNTGFYS